MRLTEKQKRALNKAIAMRDAMTEENCWEQSEEYNKYLETEVDGITVEKVVDYDYFGLLIA